MKKLVTLISLCFIAPIWAMDHCIEAFPPFDASLDQVDEDLFGVDLGDLAGMLEGPDLLNEEEEEPAPLIALLGALMSSADSNDFTPVMIETCDKHTYQSYMGILKFFIEANIAQRTDCSYLLQNVTATEWESIREYLELLYRLRLGTGDTTVIMQEIRTKLSQCNGKTIVSIMELAEKLGLEALMSLAKKAAQGSRTDVDKRINDHDSVTIRVGGHTYDIRLRLARLSKTLRNLMEDVSIDDGLDISIPEQQWIKIRNTLEYVYAIDTQAENEREARKEIINFLKSLDGITLIEFIMAVNYLDITILLDCAMEVANQADLVKVPAELMARLPVNLRNPLILRNLVTQFGDFSFEPASFESSYKKNTIFCIVPGKVILQTSTTELTVFNLHTGAVLLKLRHPGKVFAACVTRDGAKIVSCCSDSKVYIWDSNTGKRLSVLKGHTETVTCADVVDELIVTGSHDNTVRGWNIRTGEEVFVLANHAKEVTAVYVADDGKIISGTADDSMIYVWDTKMRKQLAKWVNFSSFMTNRDLFLNAKGSAWLISTGEKLSLGIEGKSTCVDLGQGKIVAGLKDGTVRVWDREKKEEAVVCNGHTDEITGVRITPAGTKVVSVARDNMICVWDVQTGNRLMHYCCDSYIKLLSVTNDLIIFQSLRGFNRGLSTHLGVLDMDGYYPATGAIPRFLGDAAVTHDAKLFSAMAKHYSKSIAFVLDISFLKNLRMMNAEEAQTAWRYLQEKAKLDSALINPQECWQDIKNSFEEVPVIKLIESSEPDQKKHKPDENN